MDLGDCGLLPWKLVPWLCTGAVHRSCATAQKLAGRWRLRPGAGEQSFGEKLKYYQWFRAIAPMPILQIHGRYINSTIPMHSVVL